MTDHAESERPAKKRATMADEPTLAVQPKLRVGSVDDPAERNADQVAAEVVRRLRSDDGPSSVGSAQPSDRIRRATAESASGAGFEAGPDVESRIRRAMPTGTPLESGVRSAFEGAMGTDLGDVRIHRSAAADQLNSDLSAKAFTTGNHVFFSQGSYDPGSSSGQELIAHELAHTVQQGGRVQRRVIRRLALDGTNFANTNAVTVEQRGSSGKVAEYSDGGSSLIVKVDQGNAAEVLAANNLHAAVAGEGASGGFQVMAPKTRIATPQERAILKAKAQQFVAPGTERNFITGLDTNQPVVIMEKGSGKNFAQAVAEDTYTKTVTKKRRFGRSKQETHLSEDSLVMRMILEPGPLTTLGASVVPDVVMGMKDRLMSFNPDNFMFDAATATFGFIDNTQNFTSGFLTAQGGNDTAEKAFRDFAADQIFGMVGSDPHGLADYIWDLVFAPNGVFLDVADQQIGGLLVQQAQDHRSEMVGYLEAGIVRGRGIVSSLLMDPLPLLSGLPRPKMHEAATNLLARHFFINGLSADAAWAAAQVQIGRLWRKAGLPPAKDPPKPPGRNTLPQRPAPPDRPPPTRNTLPQRPPPPSSSPPKRPPPMRPT